MTVGPGWMPHNYRYGGGVSDTTLTPITITAVVVGIAAMFLLPRRLVIVPTLLLCILIPSTQTIVLGGIHLFVNRIVVVAGLVRCAMNRDNKPMLAGGSNNIDRLFTCWAIIRACVFVLQYGETAAFINQLSFLWDSLGWYFVLRMALRSRDDILVAVRTLAAISIVIAAGMLYEHLTVTNLFSFVGGQLVPAVREGKVRSQGPFSHAIMAGNFGATSIPLYVLLWSTRRAKALAIGSFVAGVIIVITSSSSTSLAACAAGLTGLLMWPLRRHMRGLRWVASFALLALAVVMKAPIWFLLARIDLAGGSSGYHRAMLIDTCIRRIGDWWLLGTSHNATWGWDMWDTQNQFVTEALKGGLATLVFFVLFIVRLFGNIGHCTGAIGAGSKHSWLHWVLGCVLWAHVVAFFGADYFDQVRMWWYCSLAMVSAAACTLHSDASPLKGTALIQKPIGYAFLYHATPSDGRGESQRAI